MPKRKRKKRRKKRGENPREGDIVTNWNAWQPGVKKKICFYCGRTLDQYFYFQINSMYKVDIDEKKVLFPTRTYFCSHTCLVNAVKSKKESPVNPIPVDFEQYTIDKDMLYLEDRAAREQYNHITPSDEKIEKDTEGKKEYSPERARRETEKR